MKARQMLQFLGLLTLAACSKPSVPSDRAQARASVIPGPGSVYHFVWEDRDSAGRIIARSNDTVHFIVLDTGIHMLGRSEVISLSWFTGDTLYASYDRPDELQIASTSHHWWSWDGWASMPQVIVSLKDLPIAKSDPEIVAWYIPEIGFFSRFANYEVQGDLHRVRIHHLIGYELK